MPLCFSRVYQVSTEWVESCLEETACSVNVMIMPLSVTSMESVWWVTMRDRFPTCGRGLLTSPASPQACTHNITGPQCDQCLPGFYGDATEGTTDDCQLCPCPLTELSNRFVSLRLIQTEYSLIAQELWDHLCASGSVPPVCWRPLDRCSVTSVRTGTLEPTVRGESERLTDPVRE